MTMEISEKAPAKVNLDLFVTGKREDGYHLLDSLVVFSDFGDELHVRTADEMSLEVSGPYAAAVPTDENNLVLKAAKALQQLSGCKHGASIHLVKNIPAAAGVGGGSADAAACLRALSKLWDVTVSEADMQKMALSLGADIPVCLASQASIMRGVGESLTPVDALPKMAILLVNPGVSLSTPAVFKQRTADFSSILERASLTQLQDIESFIAYCRAQQNDLTEPASKLTSTVTDVLSALEGLEGCLLSRMSGSGATCFALFADLSQAHAAKQDLKKLQNDWWVEASWLLSGER